MSIYEELAAAEKAGKPVAFCTVVETNGSVPRHAGSKMLVYEDGSFSGTVGGGGVEELVLQSALVALKDGEPKLISYSLNQADSGAVGLCGGEMKIYVEPILQPTTLIVVGAGHVGREVVRLAKWLNYRVFLSDDRTEYCNEATVPNADAYFPIAMEDIPAQVKITPQTLLILVTRGSEVDVKGLPNLLKTSASYIGLIGSRKRWQHTRQKLIESGLSEDQINRVTCPIGLDIGAETPQEIAVSIIAEIIKFRAKKSVA